MSVDYGKPTIINLDNTNESELVAQIAEACSTWGFFQIMNHNVPSSLLEDFKSQSEKFFSLPMDVKRTLKRDGSNSRGYFDDELTKQRRDWKEAVDIGVPGSRNWSLPDDCEENGCLDGYNRFPPPHLLPIFRPKFVRYFKACEKLSDRISILIAKGLGMLSNDNNDADFVSHLCSNHTSYLRTNYYPPYIPDEMIVNIKADDSNFDPPLGISPHKDAGFLTVLMQDDDCHSLQVARFENGDESKEPDWITISPEPCTFTVNIGDMAQIYSNGRYRAPLHRVLTATKSRISAPFFYNPGYNTIVTPFPSLTERQLYHSCCWGYFRAVRFSGDFTDLGIEIQISDFLKSDEKEAHTASSHLEKQDAFLCDADFTSPFSIERYRPLLV